MPTTSLSKDNTFKIKTFNEEHTCVIIMKLDKRKLISIDWISKERGSMFEVTPLVKIKAIGKKLKVKFGIKVNKHKLYS